MWLTKKFVMEDFAAEVKRGKYKKIDYQTWRELKQLPEQWDLNIQSYLSASEKNPMYATIAWDGCNYPYEFSIDDRSFGQYVYDLISVYDTPLEFNLNTTDFANSIQKVSEAAVNAGAAIRAAAQASNWAVSSSNDWKYASVSSSFYEKQPAVEITENGLKINGKTINEIIDDATGVSIRKEKDNMDLIKNFDFGSCANDNVKVSMYGIAVKNANGTWVSYNPKTGDVMDVDILNFDGKYLYKMPVALKDVKSGDVVIHNRKPMFVSKVEGGKILAIDPAAGEEKVIMLTKNMFGFDFATKVINLFEGFTGGASADAPFGNMFPLMMLADDKNNDMLPFMLMMNGNKMDSFNPMMMYFLMKDNKGDNDMLPFLLMNNFSGNCNCHCDCDCDREG